MNRLEFKPEDFQLPNGEWLNPAFAYVHAQELFDRWLLETFSGRRIAMQERDLMTESELLSSWYEVRK